MSRAFADIAFTPSVLAQQEAHGSRGAYARMLTAEADSNNTLSEREAAFITVRDGFYLASVSETGWPYVQFRGGPRGFLKVLDPQTLAFADFRGNRQYITTGNLSVDDRVSLFLMDYPNRARLKVWGHARLVPTDDDPELIGRLHHPAYSAQPERAVVIRVAAFDWNCPQHIPVRLTFEEMETALAPVRQQMTDLMAENQRLRAELGAFRRA